MHYYNSSMNATMNQRRKWETPSPYVINATTCMAMSGVDLMSEAMVSRCIWKECTVDIKVSITDQGRNRSIKCFRKRKRTRKTIEVCECFIQIAEQNYLLDVGRPVRKFFVELMAQL